MSSALEVSKKIQTKTLKKPADGRKSINKLGVPKSTFSPKTVSGRKSFMQPTESSKKLNNSRSTPNAKMISFNSA